MEQCCFIASEKINKEPVKKDLSWLDPNLETLSIKCFHPQNIVAHFSWDCISTVMQTRTALDIRYLGPFYKQQLLCGVYHPEKMQPDAHYPPSSGADLQQQRQLENAGTTVNKSVQLTPKLTQQISCFRLLIFQLWVFRCFSPSSIGRVQNVLEDMQTGGLRTGRHWQATHYVVSIISHIQQGGK